jgi:hypothetical protein
MVRLFSMFKQHRLQPRHTNSASVTPLEEGQPGQHWRLEIAAGPAGNYRLAQLDDYKYLRRTELPWQGPVRMILRARLSANDLPGTWGFGLWNDPFSFTLGLGGMGRRIPALPNAAWFFYASPPNYLSFRDDLPAQGLLAATFASPSLPGWLLALGSPGLPLALISPLGRLLRRAVRRIVHQGAGGLALDAAEWHEYEIDLGESEVAFGLDGQRVYASPAALQGPWDWCCGLTTSTLPGLRMAAGYGFLQIRSQSGLEIADFRMQVKD